MSKTIPFPVPLFMFFLQYGFVPFTAYVKSMTVAEAHWHMFSLDWTPMFSCNVLLVLYYLVLPIQENLLVYGL
jgi:hypothetical protein